MMNMDQNKLMETINSYIIDRYTQNIYLLRTKVLKLYNCFPKTGAVNISDPIRISMIVNLKKFISCTTTESKN